MFRALLRKNHCFLYTLLEVPSFYMGISALFYTNGELIYRIYVDKWYHTQIFRAHQGGAEEAMTSGTQDSMWHGQSQCLEKGMDPELSVQPELVQEVTKNQLRSLDEGTLLLRQQRVGMAEADIATKARIAPNSTCPNWSLHCPRQKCPQLPWSKKEMMIF